MLYGFCTNISGHINNISGNFSCYLMFAGLWLISTHLRDPKRQNEWKQVLMLLFCTSLETCRTACYTTNATSISECTCFTLWMTWYCHLMTSDIAPMINFCLTKLHITGWAAAQTCCISQCTKYRKSGIFGYPWEQNPWTDRHETWGAWLRRGPYLNFQIW